LSKPYDRIFSKAQTWAQDENCPDNLRTLAQCLAENVGRLSDGIFVEDHSWKVYARFGCAVCSRLGHAICPTHGVAVPGCPLGLWEAEGDTPAVQDSGAKDG
jgi:hypothetical protein